ncbi:MAG: response regulator transcription factor [Dehalococcoidia bacterium]|nr:response regulator transcription factor [Dehalococcoidia bacterium]
MLGNNLESAPALALIDTAYMTSFEVERYAQACTDAGVPAIALVPRTRVPGLEPSLPLADFITSPPDPDELVVRARRVLESGKQHKEDDSHIIRAGDIQIDTSSYDVTIRGSRIGLTFKEYELLKLLAENPGRVFSRYALLNQIWGYEYFGGTRTVDVHIRRLRSKIQDAEHNFIETIWNVGYRFREER